MRESIYKDASPLYEETLATCRDFIHFSHKGDTLKLLEIRAMQAEIQLFNEEGSVSIDRLHREMKLGIAMEQLVEQESIKQRKK